jgi:hypothetical protein
MKKYLLKSIGLFSLVMAFSVMVSAQEKYQKPILITSAGQSADVKLVKLLAKKQSIDAESKLMANAPDLEGIKTLVIVPGFSSKGLGAAGISQQDEMDRVEQLIEETNNRNIPIVMLHVGGNARRGGQSDDFCRIVAENAKEMIVVSQGNEDGFFTEIANNKNINLQEVENIGDAGEPFRLLFEE